MSDGTIRVLAPELADKIAAGEVVQRPASAVKELVENSLDAGARSVTIVIRDAGRTLLQVVDDGRGMGWDDAVAAFSRHATSKIASAADLSNIATMGFRGEALAALSAVSIVELKTRTAADEAGALVRMEGGKLALREKAAAAVGSSIAVKNLFYNTPARRKFLKSDVTEYRHILDAVQRAALSRPDVAFTLSADGETVLQCRPGTLAERVAAIFGVKHSEGLVAGREDSAEGSIEGFLGIPKFARKGRSEQYLFLNRRPIVSRNLGHAVYRAYEHLLEKGSFPFFILFLEVDPRRTDVNVHPSKLEVKFDDEGSVYRWIHGMVRRTLAAHDLGLPGLARGAGAEGFSGAPVALPAGGGVSEPLRSGAPGGDFGSVPGTMPWGVAIPGAGRPAGPASAAASAAVESLFAPGPAVAGGAGRSLPASAPAAQLQQVHDKYILLPTGEGVMIIDQHAAHERVIYERAVRRFDSMEKASQELLFPQTIELPASEAAVVRELSTLLESLGFVLKLFGANTVILEGVPTDIRPGFETTILRDVIGLFREDEQRVRLDPRERLAKTYSCKAAVKAGDRLNGAEMASLVEQLFRTEVPYVCPHGRPVMIRLTLSELDRRFGRTS